MQPSFLGIEIGGTKLQVVTGDASASILKRQRFTVDPSKAPPASAASWKPCSNKSSPPPNPQPQVSASAVPWIGKPARSAARTKSKAGRISISVAGSKDHRRARVCGQRRQRSRAGRSPSRRGQGCQSRFLRHPRQRGVGGGLVTDGRIYHGAAPGEAEIWATCDWTVTVPPSIPCSGWAVDPPKSARSGPATLQPPLPVDRRQGRWRSRPPRRRPPTK